MIELLKKQWEYILYKDNDELILSVVCGTIALYDIEIKLSAEQKEKFSKEGQGFIDLLAEEIRYNPLKYNKR